MLLSHLRSDHADPRSLHRIDCSGPVLAPYPARDRLSRNGVRGVRELRPGQSVPLCDLTITATRAADGGRRCVPFGPTAEPIGYLIHGSRSIYFAGDTDVLGATAELRGAVDVALLPICGWGPRLGPGRLDPERAAVAAALISPAIAIPIHWGTFARPWSSWRGGPSDRPAAEFARLVRQYAPAVEVRVLNPGGSIEL